MLNFEKRFFDLFFSCLFFLIISPLLIIISILIFFSDGWPIIFIQDRVGQNWKKFKIYKFRTMNNKTPKYTIGITNINSLIVGGNFLRKFRLDEMPQLINIFKGEMSFVGPRPEIAKFAKAYDFKSAKIFKYKPGLISPASIKYSNESDLLNAVFNKEEFYIKKIVPKKIAIDLKYFRNESLWFDLCVFLRILKINKRQ